jgi:23S rRNA (pseudouridine1915-N3)-methyltransferase
MKRIAWPTRITELPDHGGRIPPLPASSKQILLDERGKQLGSKAFAEMLERWRDEGTREVRFLIGAADGHDHQERDHTDLLLAFGAATWPHLLVRAMLAEQLWRATSILANHPYHREG